MSNVIKISELPDFNDIRLSSSEIITVIYSLDNSLFEIIDDIELNLDFVDNILDTGTIPEEYRDIVDNILTNEIYADIKRALDLVTLITHIDPVYNEETNTFLEIYDASQYVENIQKLTFRYGNLITKASEIKSR